MARYNASDWLKNLVIVFMITVVTLEGHVIDKSGAMSGGGFKKVGSDKLMIFKRQYAAKSANSLAEATTSQKEVLC